MFLQSNQPTIPQSHTITLSRHAVFLLHGTGAEFLVRIYIYIYYIFIIFITPLTNTTWRVDTSVTYIIHLLLRKSIAETLKHNNNPLIDSIRYQLLVKMPLCISHDELKTILFIMWQNIEQVKIAQLSFSHNLCHCIYAWVLFEHRKWKNLQQFRLVE